MTDMETGLKHKKNCIDNLVLEENRFGFDRIYN